MERLKNLIVFSPILKRLAYKILINPHINESFLYKFFYNQKIKKAMSKYINTPHRLRIENTNICNADCIFCPHQSMKRKQGIMDFELFKKIIDQARLYNIPVVSIHGFGEPLLDKYFFQRVKYAREKGLKRIATNTNALFLNEQRIEKLMESGLDEIYISFDAATEDTYKKIRPGSDFKTVEANIKKIIDEKKKKAAKLPKIYLSFVECPQNSSEVDLYLKKWKGLVDGVSISYLVNWGGRYSGENLLRHTQKRDPCRFLWTDMAISWDGRATICCYDYENETIIGDISNESIKDIWSGETLESLRQMHAEHNFDKIDICKECVANIHSKNPWWVVK